MGQKQLLVFLPGEVHRQLKVNAASSGMTMKDYLAELTVKDGDRQGEFVSAS
jgi:hypothetical protein